MCKVNGLELNRYPWLQQEKIPALEPKRLQLISGGHFAPYLDQFPLAVAAATEWFSEHLLNPGARRVTQVAIQSASAQANSDIANV